MPRGGPDASWWDRRYETRREEYIDRPETGARCRQALRGLDRFQRLSGGYRTYSRLAVAAVGDDVPRPRVLELGAGHGRLARHVLARRPGARVTVSDVNPLVVEALRAGPLGRDRRIEIVRLDATAIDRPDGAYDVAVLTTCLHHLPPSGVAAVLREGTRVARRLLVVDGWRNPLYLAAVPLMALTGGWAQAHDGFVSLRRMYGAAAVHALAERCGAPVRVRTRFVPPAYLAVLAERRADSRRTSAVGRASGERVGPNGGGRAG
ncbi:class I SAM-dependent methyltransferase [Streptomyces sp. OF3]|uniref:Class I SAM-dependent methyltransferase n=2 Tax=Streptomyces alkaliterrae TaxID=2213162 RepID=A0A5P0YYY4_9ACTN|nr:class I SAM-dependent methyltransferase [Streptomyces alkaliterrae]MBB1262083.1 class I SAM-dependent methyltransferase [Streptomyces alkaliterrae]MQS04757.1 methyltransferase domain-containing protein [Streptomyces alkaliterrae]